MKMQVTSLAVFLFATLATSSAQNTTAVTGAQKATTGMETTSSGDGETDECEPGYCENGGTCSVESDGSFNCTCLTGFSGDNCQTDICMDNQCQNGATCIRSDSTYDCQCSPGYNGTNCEDKVSCSELTLNELESAISNVDSCSETYTGTSSGSISLDFPSVEAGSWSQANQNCNASCVVPGITQPMAIALCNESGIFVDIAITNCSAGAEDLTAQQQLPYAIVASEPSTATSEGVDYAITVTTDFTSSGTSITATEAGQTIDIYNNLLQVENTESKTTVNDQSDAILVSIDDLSKAVLTTTRAADREFVDIDTNIALAVVDISGGGEATFAANADLGSVTDLTTAGLRIDDTAPGSGSYVTVAGSGNFRISFRAYITSDVLFQNFPADVVLQQTVLSASIVDGSIPSDGQFIFNFENKNNGLTERDAANCQRWERTSKLWVDGGCTTSLTSNAVQCICNEDGAYVAVATVNVVTDEGLSPGAIAGIVIGSVVGAALIGGGIYYFAVVKKKKANSIHMEMNEADDAVPKAAAPKDASPKAEVPEVTDTESRTEV